MCLRRLQSYDCLDPDDASFVADYEQFTARVLDLDRRMATCVCQAYDDCVCSESVFKVRRQHFHTPQPTRPRSQRVGPGGARVIHGAREGVG